MLFGPEWQRPEPPKPKPRQPGKPRKKPICPEWIAELLDCENCGNPRCATSGKFTYAACRQPGCSKLVPRSVIVRKIEQSRTAELEIDPGTPELARCLRMAFSYLRGRMRRKGT